MRVLRREVGFLTHHAHRYLSNKGSRGCARRMSDQCNTKKFNLFNLKFGDQDLMRRRRRPLHSVSHVNRKETQAKPFVEESEAFSQASVESRSGGYPYHIRWRCTMGFWRQLRVILWKNIVVYSFKRHYVLTFFTMAVPLMLSGVLLYLRSLGFSGGTEPIVRMNATVYEEFAPSFSYSLLGPYPYAPNTTYGNNLMKAVFKSDVIGFPTEEELEAFIARYAFESPDGTSVAVILHGLPPDGSPPVNLSYTLRFNTSHFNFKTGERFPTFRIPGPRDEDHLYSSLMWGLQDKMFTEHVKLLKSAKGLARQKPKIAMHRFPYPEYNDDNKFDVISRLIAMFVVYSYLVFSPIYVRRVISEKSSRVRELMRMMGLTDWVYWIGTFSSGWMVLAATLTISLILFKIPVAPLAAVLLYSDFSLLLFICLIYATSAILFLLIFTVIFNSAVVGVIFSTVGWVISYSLPTSILDPLGSDRYMSISRSAKLSTSLLPNSGLYWAFRLISFLEGQGIGAKWSNLGMEAVPADNVTLGQIILIMLTSVLIYALLLWYLDNVWPFQYGIPKHPFFFLQIIDVASRITHRNCYRRSSLFYKSKWWYRRVYRLVWKRLKPKIRKKSYWYTELDHDSEMERVTGDTGNTDENVFEPPPPDAHTTIALSHVTKKFRGTLKKAVDNLSLEIFDGQLTVLLGHNGAGKTTTMNMITGLFPPTRGEVHINGYNIRTQTKKARESFGLCPQHNVLFDELTVEEHLYFFYSLKDSPDMSWKSHVNDVLVSVDLGEKRSSLAKDLSGGMKRKLSLGNAMIGGSKILILDEPTAGMDPQARRAVWTLLQNLRRSKTILLTTHYMEEADALGDRIAFVAHGKLQCCGSPLFLKKRYGTGYRMRIAKGSSCSLNVVTEKVTSAIPAAQLTSDIGHEAMFNLGFPPASDVIPLLKNLEQSKESLGIASLGISVTTMEDVFIRVGELADISVEMSSASSSSHNGTDRIGGLVEVLWKKVDECQYVCVADDEYPTFQRMSGLPLLAQQATALFLKRWHTTKRQYFLPILAIVIPVVLFFFYTALDIEGAEESTIRKLVYDVGSYAGPTNGFFSNGTSELGSMDFVDAMTGQNVKVTKDVDDPDDFLLVVARRSLAEYNGKYLVGGQTDGDAKAVAWYNGEPYHIGSMSLNLAHTAALRYITSDATAKVSVTNWPLPGELSEQIGAASYDQAARILAAVFVPTALAFLSSSFVLFPTHERVTKSKLLQLMAGVPGVLFWGITFLWDFVVFAVCSTAVMIPLLAINPNGVFTSSPSVPAATYFLFLLYGWAAIPFSYLFSYVKDKPSSGYSLLTTINVITGVMLSIVMAVVSFLAKFPMFGINEDAVQKSMWFLRVVPGFAVTWGFSNIHEIGGDPAKCAKLTSTLLKSYCPVSELMGIEVCCQDCGNGTYCYIPHSPFGMDRWGSGREMLYLFLVGIVLFLLLAFFETNVYGIWYWIRSLPCRTCHEDGATVSLTDIELGVHTPGATEDDDVAAERAVVEALVQRGSAAQEALAVLNLRKNFRSLQAVDNLTFAVHKNECFGLLGVNGAGKTTTFRMLTGDLPMSSGNAYLGEASLQKDLKEFQSKIGYCPQFDAQIDKLTGRETLELFAFIRGVPTHRVPSVVNYMINLADLQAHANKPTEAYSGGSRRKLSIAMALIGNPPVVFLDEPTAGVDPAARRKIWQGLDDVQKLMGAAVILTSHSMEECEALCQRISIMVNGSFRCLGSTQHLKSKFGDGFTVIVKMGQEQAASPNAVPAICTAMLAKFPGNCVLRDSHQALLHFHVTDTSLRWSQLFETLEALKQELSFEDYIVSDTTLEQIFLAFARSQRDATTEAPVSCWRKCCPF
ncbi:phospholipid-transporting ATPase ABCA3-like isoform X4 [Rhipicephalus microplus]|uniref:phospholipid-transporting ATPase ABCA3-like isoform X4 n=1 Tax=Rhipicephalus microplus TaxID=6941 RepID=UPI003F6C842F